MTSDLYKTFWRWHFYAGVIVLPFLCWLAITGGIYLFKPEVERLVYGDWVTLSAERDPMPLSAMIAEVERQAGGTVSNVQRPSAANESWRMRVEVGERAQTAFVDPADGRLLGTTDEGGVMKTVKELHSLAITGDAGTAIIEIAAGWAILLIVTGVALWWPAKGKPALALRGPSRSRRFWRDLHASTGAIAGAVILFLAVTGMPWSYFWGAQLRKIVAEQGLGRPELSLPKASMNAHHHGRAEARRDTLPWALQETGAPDALGRGDAGVDRAVAVAERRGLVAPYSISLPAEPDAPYAISRASGKAGDARVIYVDAASAAALEDVGFDRFGAGAKAIEWGIAVHQGQEYGAVNRWVMLAGCIATLLLAITAPVLWWKRRVQGSAGLPPPAIDPRRGRPALIVTALLAILYPLTGLTVLLVGLIDRFLLARRPSAISS